MGRGGPGVMSSFADHLPRLASPARTHPAQIGRLAMNFSPQGKDEHHAP